MLTRSRSLSLTIRPHIRFASSISSSSEMQIIENVSEFHDVRRQIPAGTSIGFVPTMGGLHEGHLSLVHAAKQKCDLVVASVFVNPTQFGPNEDFTKYPRTFERDMNLLRENSIDLVFAPTAEAMYTKNHRCFVFPEGFDQLREGQCRPGHFRGVATIVTKLFHVVSPTHAFFGAKDAAQCVLVKRLVEDLNMDIQIEVVPVARESDGLAMSTRNQYLNEQERIAASVLYRGLSLAKTFYDAQPMGSIVNAKTLRTLIHNEYQREPLVSDIQYISVGNKETMEEVETIEKGQGAILSVALKVGTCRLIDTMTLD